MRHIDKAIPSGRIILNSHAASFVERVFHQGHQRPRECLKRSVVAGKVLQHGCRYWKHDPLRRKASAGENVVDQEPVNPAIAILERMEENETVRHSSSVNHGGHISHFHLLVGRDHAFH